MYDWLIVGAGFAGSVLAERLANERGDRVLVVDRRSHIAGNAYDKYNEAGILIHQYGPHIFHTNSELIFRYLSKFTTWRLYEHRVLAFVDGQYLPIPINLTTINKLYGLQLDSSSLESWFKLRAESVAEIKTSEDAIVSVVGREIYEKFYRTYTRKQWGVDPSELDKSVTSRIPIRTSADDRYFTDKFQFMPEHGYTRMFERILKSTRIDVKLNCDYRTIKDRLSYRRVIYTGPIDEYFNHCYGKLPYRSLRFEHCTIDTDQFQETGTINYPQTENYTRISEYKHLTGQIHDKTSITYEFPSADGDPYYPIPTAEHHELFKKYERLSLEAENVWFVGRLATYRYYNMDQVVGQALSTYRRIMDKLGAS